MLKNWSQKVPLFLRSETQILTRFSGFCRVWTKPDIKSDQVWSKPVDMSQHVDRLWWHVDKSLMWCHNMMQLFFSDTRHVETCCNFFFHNIMQQFFFYFFFLQHTLSKKNSQTFFTLTCRKNIFYFFSNMKNEKKNNA